MEFIKGIKDRWGNIINGDSRENVLEQMPSFEQHMESITETEDELENVLNELLTSTDAEAIERLSGELSRLVKEDHEEASSVTDKEIAERIRKKTGADYELRVAALGGISSYVQWNRREYDDDEGCHSLETRFSWMALNYLDNNEKYYGLVGTLYTPDNYGYYVHGEFKKKIPLFNEKALVSEHIKRFHGYAQLYCIIIDMVERIRRGQGVAMEIADIHGGVEGKLGVDMGSSNLIGVSSKDGIFIRELKGRPDQHSERRIYERGVAKYLMKTMLSQYNQESSPVEKQKIHTKLDLLTDMHNFLLNENGFKIEKEDFAEQVAKRLHVDSLSAEDFTKPIYSPKDLLPFYALQELQRDVEDANREYKKFNDALELGNKIIAKME